MPAFSEGPPKYAALHWDGKMLRDVLEVILGPRQRLWLCLSPGPPAYPEGKLLGVTSDRQLNRNGSAEASMDLLEAWGLTGVITALVFDTTATTVEYIGEGFQASGATA
ncbi:hypothetical protein GWK47_013336 [Chionoecetes opilio]|uniref:Uncharacterized protein n=1 Tax=Chionoecetes opilio TaxID=41210 RepID=A0A8J4XVJ3_CHIOP|nr:hypothetical protein GWK47_013336 [Chionoecetes opilio]